MSGDDASGVMSGKEPVEDASDLMSDYAARIRPTANPTYGYVPARPSGPASARNRLAGSGPGPEREVDRRPQS